MSSISGITGSPQPIVPAAVALQRSAASPAASTVRDADGDYDGTRIGETDPRDSGKGQNVDVRA